MSKEHVLLEGTPKIVCALHLKKMASMRWDYAHIDVIPEILKTRESIVDVGPLSFYDESTVHSKNVI